MSRARKLLIVGLVLALGIGLAWPFRSAGPQIVPVEPVEPLMLPVREAVSLESPAPPAKPAVPATRPLESHLTATMASTGEAISKSAAPGFDVENHPALAHEPRDVPPPSNPFTQSAEQESTEARPAYATGYSPGREKPVAPEETIHVVQNGDTLEKLAQRYLGDKARALELFDLNREQLSNPHLLPIGAELRIPVPPQRDVD